MSRNSQISQSGTRRNGPWILASIPAACRNAFATFALTGRSKSSTPPFARKMLFEALEPRLLLSADLNPVAAALNPQDQSSSEFVVSSTLVEAGEPSPKFQE